MTPDPRREDQPAADGTTFGEAAARDEELVDDLVDAEDDLGLAQRRYERQTARHDIEGAHPPADAGDREQS